MDLYEIASIAAMYDTLIAHATLDAVGWAIAREKRAASAPAKGTKRIERKARRR